MTEIKLPQLHKRVEGQGNVNATIALVGEAPGAEEVVAGIPFVGTAGKFLNQILERAGINRAVLYVTNVIKVRPPDNKIPRLKELGMTVEQFYPELYEELSRLPNLKVVVPLGGIALKALSNQDSILKYFGSILTVSKPWVVANYQDYLYCVPILHPSYVMQYAYEMSAVCGHFFKRAASIASGKYTPTARREILRPTFAAAREFLYECANADTFSYDIETAFNKITCIGFAVGRTAMCIPLKNGFNNYWTASEELVLWEDIGKALQSKALKVAQYKQYDDTCLMRLLGAPPMSPWFDTWLAHSILYAELPHDLAFQTAFYTDIPYYKDDMKDWKASQMTKSETLWSYNCKDVLATLEISERQREELSHEGLESYFYGYKQPLFRILFDMQTKGVKRSETARSTHEERLMQEIKRRQAEIDVLAGRSLNVNSSKQMGDYLYGQLKLPVQYKKGEKDGRAIQTPTCDEKAILKLSVRFTEPILRKIVELRGLMKSLSTYISVPLDKDEMIRTSYGVAETGRLTSSIPAWKNGMQVQNVPDELRDIFIPSTPDKEITKADLSQAELRIVAWLSGCKAFKEKFANNEDVMILVAAWITGRAESEFNKKSPERYLAKRTVHGSNYRMGPYTFAEHAEVPVAKAREVQAAYFTKAFEITMWQSAVSDQIKKTRTLTTPYGLTRHFYGRLDDSTFKEGIAFVPQSTCVDTCNQGILKLYYLLPSECRLLLQVHDEVVYENPKEMRDYTDRLTAWIYDRPIMIAGQPLTIPLEILHGDNWRDCK